MNSSKLTPQAFVTSITGAGVLAVTGDLDAALYGAVATRLSGSRPVAGLTVPAADQGIEQPYFAPIAALPEELKSAARIPILAREALAQTCTYLPEDRIGLRILVHTLLPASSPERPNAGNQDQEELAAALREVHPALAMAKVRFSAIDTGATALLAQSIGELHQGQWDAVLFGGADSLIDRGVIRSLASRGRCCTDRNPEGLLPGEGAAYLLLEKQEEHRNSRALISGLGHALEKNHGKAANRKMTGLAESIEQALGQTQFSPDRVESVVLPMGNDVPAHLEWHQVQRKIWPKPEDNNHEMEELTSQSAIGDSGAAALPLALVLGCARFDFNFPPADSILVCETGQGAPRGAVLLKKA